MSQNHTNQRGKPIHTVNKQQGGSSVQSTHMTYLPIIVPDPTQRHMPYPLTDLQQAYWIGQTNLIELGNTFAHAYIEFDFMNLDLARLTQVCQRLIERHDALRSIVLADGYQQVLSTTPPYQIAVTDFREKGEGETLVQLMAIRERMDHDGPNTATWPLWEIRASLLDQQRTRLHVSFCLLLLDASSLPNLVKEGLQLYAEPECVLPPLELTYRDYVLALHTLEQTEVYEQSYNYWQQRLSSLPPVAELPLAKHPDEIHKAHFVNHTARLDASTWQRLQERISHLGQGFLTPTVVMYAVYAEVLAAWSKTAHFTIDLVVSNRFPMHPQVKDLVGNFNATVLLEVNYSEPASFLVRAQRLQQQLLDDLAHSYVSGVQMIREIAKAHGWTSKALMPVAFASSLRKEPTQGEGLFSMARERVKPIYQCLQTPQVYLDVQVFDGTDGLLVMWMTVDELFPEGVPEQMLTAYCQLLQVLAENETMWQQEHHSLMSSGQLALYADVNATDVPIPTNLLQTLVDKQTALHPSQVAVISSERTLLYGELHRMAIQVGHWLRQSGALPNTLVGVVTEKGWEQIVATLGILYAGAAYLPIDPSLPQERFEYLLNHGAVDYVLTQSWVDERYSWPTGIQRLPISDASLVGLPTQELESVQKPEDLAYVIYTSGSTGVPKGVMIEHRAVVNTLVDLIQRFSIGPNDRVLALSALSFDLSVYDLFGMLGAGGVVVVPNAQAVQDVAHWAHLLLQEQVTIWNSVPALMEILIEHLIQHGERLPTSLRLVMLSGDWIPVWLPDKIKSLGDQAIQVVSLGGATEASIWSILYPIERVDPKWTSIPYGRPMANQHVYVLNADYTLRPSWVSGDLYIGGRGLARGYWRDEAKTHASFMFHPQTDERLYRTGDLGRYLPDGTIEFLGREDLQVKVQGYRIELGEIEVVLVQHSGVREAIVTVEETQQQGKRLVAYVVPQSMQRLDSNELRAFIRSKLPAYMVPSGVVVIESVPLTANGKVDRKALPQWEGSILASSTNVIGTRDELEWQLMQVWETILERHPIGVNDNFFELGGNSLAALRLMGRLRQFCGYDLPLSMLFERSTVAQLASILRLPVSQLQQRSPLVAMQPNGSKTACFWVHPVGGNVLCYAEMTRQLGDERAIYGLRALGLELEEIPLSSMEEMAACYIRAMRRVQPSGPYVLGGWSMGGIVAFEMAQQLHKEGVEDSLVILMDSEVPVGPKQVASLDDTDLLVWFAKDLSGGVGNRLMLQEEVLRRLEPEERLHIVLEQARAAQIVPVEANIAYLRRLVEVFKANAQAMLRYMPQRTSLRTVLLVAEETVVKHGGDQTLGWEKLIGHALEVYSLQGNHYSIMSQPYVERLAAALKRYIEQAHKAS